MAEVIMPKMGDAMEEGTLLKWLKAVGDEVAEGDALAEIETDKVTLELEAQEDGFLTNTLVEEGAVVPIGESVAIIGTQDEVGQSAPAPAVAPEERQEAPAEAEQVPASSADEASEAAAAQPAEKSGESAQQVVDRKPGERVRASPLVKRLAQEHGIDLSQVAGTGPGGRIINGDIQPYVSGEKSAPQAAAQETPVEAATPSPSPAPSAAEGKGVKVDMPKIKRTTGKRMSESKLGIPHYYVTSDVDMEAALAFRKEANASLGEDGGRVSVNDLVVKAAALALRDNPNVNRTFVGGELYQQESIDVNIAIAIDGGLIAPFVPGADQKSLGEISRLTKDLGKRARVGGLTLEEYQGGTFTISNLGMFDVDEFIAVINPPQVAILAIGSVQETPVVKNGEVVAGPRMKITLSADHRALDGAEVATFLQSVKKYLENPMMLALS